MASQKLTALTALTTPDPADLTYIVDDVAGTPVERKITLADLARGFRTVVCSGQSLTGSEATSLVDLAATWNTTGTPTAILLNVTDTASNAASLLMDLRVGGVSRFRITKAGSATFANMNHGAASFDFINSLERNIRFSSGNITPLTTGVSALGSNALAFANVSTRVLLSDNAVIEQRDGTNAQTFRVYNTFTDASNHERGFMRWSSNVLQVGTEAAGTGTARELHLQTAGVTRLQISGSNLTTGNAGSLTFLNSGGNAQFQLTTTAGFNGLHLATGGLITWGSGTTLNGTQVLGLAQAATGILTVTNGTTGGASLEFREQTAPAAPSTDNVRIYAEDNGSGKTRLMARFATGAAVQIAIEP